MPRHATKTSFKKGDPRLIGNQINKGRVRTEEQNRQQSELMKKRECPNRFKKGDKPHNTGKERSEECKKKVSETLKLKYQQGLKSKGGGKFKGFRRTKLIEEIKKCEKCGFDNKLALVLHHLDGDKGNNTRENLLLLCANCHYIIHGGKFNGKNKNKGG